MISFLQPMELPPLIVIFFLTSIVRVVTGSTSLITVPVMLQLGNWVEKARLIMGNRLLAVHVACLCAALFQAGILDAKPNGITVPPTATLLRVRLLPDSTTSNIANLSHASQYNSFTLAAHACQVLGSQNKTNTHTSGKPTQIFEGASNPDVDLFLALNYPILMAHR